MRIPIRNQARLFGATFLGALLLSGASTRAADITQTVSQSGAAATGWSAAIWGTPAAAPTAGNNYITPSTFFVRTPNNTTPGSFAGDSLRIDSGGTLWLKHSGLNAATVNLILNGGNIQFHGGTVNNTNSALAGTIQVLGDCVISSDQGAANACHIWLRSSMTGSSNFAVNMSPAGYGLFLSGSNSAFTGNWTNSGGFIQVLSGTTNALGSQTTTNGSTTTSGITNPFQTIERKDVGLVLKVTPHINEGDAVRLDLHQEVSNLLPPVQGAVDLVTNKRELTTSVLVADNALLVLGGLLDNQAKDNVQKVPVLGDIPLFGNLFRYRTNDHTKTDLMIFLHPRILRDAATEAAVSSEKYNFMRTEQLQMREEAWPITPSEQRPLLPNVHDFLASPTLDGQPAVSHPEPVRQP